MPMYSDFPVMWLYDFPNPIIFKLYIEVSTGTCLAFFPPEFKRTRE